ncbi:MAG TPA: hypothetical protein PLP27_05585 [Crocinitomicaceae bacterium]|nr:hypothetical protein [Crocinitomicaceae bacterium]
MSKYAAYFAIERKLQQHGFDMSRNEVIGQFTNQRKSRLTDLSPFEYAELLRWINSTFLSSTELKQEDVQKDTMRKKIIAILCKMGYKTTDGRADMQRIGAWATKYGKSHKQFNAYTYTELTQLVTQAEFMYNDFLSKL